MTEVKNGVNAENQAIAPAEPTSQILTNLKAAAKGLFEKLKAVEYGSKEFNDISNEMTLNKKAQVEEIAAIKRQEAENRLALLRAEKMQVIANYKDAVLKASVKNATEEAKQAEISAHDELANLVLPANFKAATGKTSGTGGSSKGAVSAEIRRLILQFVGEGMTSTEAVKRCQEPPYNHSRGTSGTVATVLRNEGLIS